MKPEQHFTEPPPRYNEASLVKELEERGIGRPSTYATILSTIQERQYVTKLGGKFAPTEIGLVVTDLLVENFRDIFDVAYTARLEEELDEVEEGKEKWTDALADFYKKFQKDLKYAEKHMENIKRMEKPTDEKCERCGSPLVIKWGKHGSFYACSSYDKENPESCTFTKENPINLPDLDSADMQETAQEEYCENCGRVMVLKRGRFGQFMACTGYPDCKTTRRLDQGKRVPDIPLDEPCPKCGRNLMIRHGRYGEFTACSGYPECKFVKQNFIGVKCPLCKDGELVEKKARKGNTFYGCSNYPKCKFTSANKPIAGEVPELRQRISWSRSILKAGPVIACPNKECDYERDAPASARQRGSGHAAEATDPAVIYSRSAPGGRIFCASRQPRSSKHSAVQFIFLRRIPMPKKPTHADAELILKLYDVRREAEIRKARQWWTTTSGPRAPTISSRSCAAKAHRKTPGCARCSATGDGDARSSITACSTKIFLRAQFQWRNVLHLREARALT